MRQECKDCTKSLDDCTCIEDTIDMKQTAVEWLVANIDWQLLRNTKTHYNMIVEKAKEMEKQQIIEARVKIILDSNYVEAEQYYNETFKNQ